MKTPSPKEEKAVLIGGEFSRLLARKKDKEEVALGELLIAEENGKKFLLQVFNLSYGSQLAQQQRELISGMLLEEDTEVSFAEPALRNYVLLQCKNLLEIKGNAAQLAKTLPPFFASLRAVQQEDLPFLAQQEEGLFLGHLRSGNTVIPIPITLPLQKTLSHHILVPATTGRGKSNLTATILFTALGHDGVGFLVLDPHDEYYGRTGIGLKDHPLAREKVLYYTPADVPPGQRSLKIHLKHLKPVHFQGVIAWSDPQWQLITAYYREKKQRWIEALIREEPIALSSAFNEATLSVVRRQLMTLLNIHLSENDLLCEGIYSDQAGEATVADIMAALEQAKTVIIDTSSFSGPSELLVGSLLAHELLKRWKWYKQQGTLQEKPVVSVVLEEAPRVLGKEVLEKGTNVFASIAREGRKFKIGLYAITQLPSLIPREILANMNTKIILGIEMQPEREAIIHAAAHDLSDYSKAIASLNKGEAIVTSNFSLFPIPLKIPYFPELVEQIKKRYQQETPQLQESFDELEEWG